MKWGTEHPEKHDLSSLRLLGSVGEPINPRAWLWYHEHIGGENCPIVDTWWQTETGGIMIAPLPGLTETKPGSATLPLPGIEAAIFDKDGNEIEEGGGTLVITQPWPGMARTLYKEDDRFIETYWDRYGKDTYLVGDAARRDEDGFFWIVGRIDDVINVSGHRLSTMEVESALVSNERVAEAAVIAVPDEDTGQAIVAFVTPEGDEKGSDDMAKELREHVADKIGKLARPKAIHFAGDLPKTRSGKIMRRLLRDIAQGKDDLGDTTTLRDPAIVEELQEQVAASKRGRRRRRTHLLRDSRGTASRLRRDAVGALREALALQAEGPVEAGSVVLERGDVRELDELRLVEALAQLREELVGDLDRAARHAGRRSPSRASRSRRTRRSRGSAAARASRPG